MEGSHVDVCSLDSKRIHVSVSETVRNTYISVCLREKANYVRTLSWELCRRIPVEQKLLSASLFIRDALRVFSMCVYVSSALF